MYEADKLLVLSDPTLTEARRSAEITRLTTELEQAEARQGITWRPVAGVVVTDVKVSGSATLSGDPPEGSK